MKYAALSFLASFACGSNKAGPCEGGSPAPECGAMCDPAGMGTMCAAGFYCTAAGTCTADCTPGGGECGSGATCSADGHCIPTNGGADANCPDVNFVAERVTPSIHLVIDRSGSMSEPFGGTTRWNATKEALVGSDGVVTQLQTSVYFGASTYTAGNTCPNMHNVDRLLNNLGAITELLDSRGPGSDTPTGESVRAVIALFAATPPPANSPPIIVLATDGEPDLCADGNDEVGGRAESVAAAQAAYAAGIQLFVLAVGTDIAQTHQQQVANAGQGLDIQTGDAQLFIGNDPASLAAAFQTIIGGVVSCQLDIDGNVNPANASSGTVTLNGTTLQFGVDWELLDSNTIRLIGAACDTLSSTSMPTVSARFPCGAVVE